MLRNFIISFSSPVDHPNEGVPLVEEGVEHVHVAGEGVLETGLVLGEEHQRPGQLQEAEQDGEQGQVVTRPTHTTVSTIEYESQLENHYFHFPSVKCLIIQRKSSAPIF